MSLHPRLLGCLLLIATVWTGSPHQARAGSVCGECVIIDYLFGTSYQQNPIANVGAAIALGIAAGLAGERDSLPPAAAVSGSPKAATFHLSNASATLQVGEPTEGGLVTKSIWTNYVATANKRIVINTFGSEPDTIVVVYAFNGTLSFSGLTRVVESHGYSVPGTALPSLTNKSLVQFDAIAGQTYVIQTGTAGSGAGGDIFLNAYELDPGGGLSAFLGVINNVPSPNFEYDCCGSPLFVLHNSTAQAMTVVPSSTLGPGVTAPAPFALASGAIGTAQFTVGTSFSTAPRIEFKSFSFSGQVGGSEIATAGYRARTVFNSSTATTILGAVAPSGRSVAINGVASAFATILNTGGATATGCYIRVPDKSSFRSNFQQTDPATNTLVGTQNAAVDIPAGQFRTFAFFVAGENSSAVPNSTFTGPMAFQCTNTALAPSSLANNFTLTSLGTVAPADMISIGVTPSGDGIINVPPGGTGFMSAASINIGATGSVTATPVYYDGSVVSTTYPVFVCQTNSTTGACMAPPSPNLTLTATQNQALTFAVFVQAPATPPAFDPSNSRVFLEFSQKPTGFSLPFLVGGTSAAVRVQ